ncbi:hypothetical protein CY35_03G122800 [Sphagnum magellanicum]|nr:hypothetical protein CY35_03G122800 [Sphagnum magellanicum]
MALVMTKEWIRKQCKQNKLYQTPAFNDRLYLHNQGFSVIENLEEYINVVVMLSVQEVKFLYLENNCIESLSGLKLLTRLRCLYLQKNCLRCIEHLEPLKDLHTLDLSENMLTKLEKLSCCRFLTILNVASNYLRSLDSIIHLMQCPSIICPESVSSTRSLYCGL